MDRSGRASYLRVASRAAASSGDIAVILSASCSGRATQVAPLGSVTGAPVVGSVRVQGSSGFARDQVISRPLPSVRTSPEPSPIEWATGLSPLIVYGRL